MSRIPVTPKLFRMLRDRGMVGDVVDKDFDYIKAGLVDSLGLLRFVLELEDTFGVALTEEDVLSTRFRTFGGLCELIEEKMNEQH